MDFVTLLRQDYERVSSLFNQIQAGSDNLIRRNAIKRELDVHAAVEDLHVYRVNREA